MELIFEKDLEAVELHKVPLHAGKYIFYMYSTAPFNASAYMVQTGHSDQELICTIPSVGNDVIFEVERTVDGFTYLNQVLVGSGSGHTVTNEKAYLMPNAEFIKVLGNNACTVKVYYER